MPPKLKKLFQGDRKYFTLFYLSILAILITGIVSPLLTDYRKKNWDNEINTAVSDISASAVRLVNEKISALLAKNSEIKRLTSARLKKSQQLLSFVNSLELKDYSLEIFNNREELAAWTTAIAVPVTDVFPQHYKPGEVHFVRSGLETYLSVSDTLKAGGITLYTVLSRPVEKHYQLQNSYFKPVSLTDHLSRRFMTTFEISYSPAAPPSRDGRKSSVEIYNNLKNKIGTITFTKPSRETSLEDLRDQFTGIQSMLAVLAFIFAAAGFKSKWENIKLKSLRVLAFISAIAVFRSLLFVLEIPSRFISGPVTDASNFASSFGFGIVKSPLDFFVTIALVLVACIYAFENLRTYYESQTRKSAAYQFYLLAFAGSAVFLILLRGLGAALKSIIFDSSLRYFKEPGLLPNLPAAFMQLNFLILGLCSVLVSVSILLFILSRASSRTAARFVNLFIILQIAGVIYDFIQSEPQGTPLIRIIYITFVFVISFKILSDEKFSTFNYVYFTLISSVITISLLNYYNTQLEKESLKTAALEVTRTNDEWLEYLVREALFNAAGNPETIETLKNQQTNYETAAFIIWSQSSLMREETSSSVTFLDRQKAFLGSFGVNIDNRYRVNPSVLNYEGEDLKIFNNYYPENTSSRIVSGILPVRENGALLGYVIASVLYDPAKIKSSNFPAFLQQGLSKNNSAVNLDKLKVFVFENGKLSSVYGDITPAVWHVENILKTPFSENNDAWINLNINNENYITYLLKSGEQKSDKIIAVALKEKNLSWSLYNFFKVFFIHSIFIIGLFIILYIIYLRKQVRGFVYTFRVQLLTAFLFISILPMVFLAYYNRALTDEKNRDLLLYRMKQNSVDIESYINEHVNENPSQSMKLIFGDAAKDLNLQFSLFSDKTLYFSSMYEFYRAGLLPQVLNPEVFEKLSYQGYKEYVAEENIGDAVFTSYYTKFRVGDREFTLKINDAFNRLPLPVTGEEVDIFLFGSYFFATILVIILSTVMANRISAPIRKLTKATLSVASGDLSLEVQNTQKGEIHDLISGFNSMIKELSRSQSELAEMEREIAWKEMARQVAHEIKNPLTPMKLAVQQLVIAFQDKSPKFEAIFDRVTKTIISQIETLNNIASEFSGFARMPNLKVERTDLYSVVTDACNLFGDENININVIKHVSDPFIEADRDHLKRTVINLVRNSLQADATEILIELSKTESRIILSVTDNGRGINEENRKKIFDTNFTTKEKGMGLGLKLAKKFMDSIKGSIYLAGSEPGRTTIVLEFPAI